MTYVKFRSAIFLEEDFQSAIVYSGRVRISLKHTSYDIVTKENESTDSILEELWSVMFENKDVEK